jgi:hypothetical protein
MLGNAKQKRQYHERQGAEMRGQEEPSPCTEIAATTEFSLE